MISRKLIVPILFAAIILPGCKKFLEKLPDNRTVLNTPGKVSELLVTAYPNYNYEGFCEIMSDNVSDRNNLGVFRPIFNSMYNFKEPQNSGTDSPDAYWASAYSAISVANVALDAISTATNPSLYTAQKGEALLARAYAHFMLVTLYSKPYNAHTSAQDAGIPYVTSVETAVFQKYDRKTVAYVYQMVEKDLNDGMALLNDAGYQQPSFHFTKRAAYAFATRFYLYKKDNAKAIIQANLAFPGNNYAGAMRPYISTYNGLSYDAFSATFFAASVPANILLVETVSTWDRYFKGERFGLSYDTIYATIYKKNIVGADWIQGGNYYRYTPKEWFTPKFLENFHTTTPGASIGVPYESIALFTTEEVLFNKAEACTLSGDYAEALKCLNIFLSQRILNYDPVNQKLTQDQILTYYNTTNVANGFISTILDFKRVEFMHEGMRWFDILRYKLPVTHTYRDGTPTVILLPNDLMRQFQLPASVSLSGIPLNPR